MKRRRNWTVLLELCIEEHRHVPFAWGTNDCCTFAGDCLLAMTGMDPISQLRGAYLDDVGAMRTLKELGGLQDAVTHMLGVQPTLDPRDIKRGGLLLVTDIKGRAAIAVCIGERGVMPGEDGITFKERTEATMGWNI